jgi:cyclase
MITHRIIPRIDIKGPNMVKGIHLEGLRVLGSPSQFAKYYYENGADEILLMDVVASLYDRNSLGEFIRESSENIFIPLTVGGGLRSIDDIRTILRMGADKVVINTAVVKKPSIISEAVDRFGSSTIAVAIEAIKYDDGRYMVFTDNGREFTGLEALEWCHKVQELGAGEIVLTSVDNEGTGKGFDIDFINKIAEFLKVPLVVHGGCGKKEDVLKVFKQTKCDAVCASSIFHYDVICHNRIDRSYSSVEGNFDFLKSNKRVSKFDTLNISELKTYLLENGIPVRN